MRLTWLPDVLRAAGLPVDVYPGWETRGSDSFGPIRGVIDHATAGSATSTDAAEMRVLWVTGSTSAPAPIAQCYLSRSGLWVVGATGRCNHVSLSDVRPWPGIGTYGNTNLIGVEAQNDNRGQPWPADQINSYTRGVAAILKHLGLSPQQTAAHREHQFGKTDPFGIGMDGFRLEVARYMGAAPRPPVLEGEVDMIIVQDPDGAQFAVWGDVTSETGFAWKSINGDQSKALQAGGVKVAAGWRPGVFAPVDSLATRTKLITDIAAAVPGGDGGPVSGPVTLTEATHLRIKADSLAAANLAEDS